MSNIQPPRYTMIRVRYSTWEKLHQLSLRGEKLVALLERLAQEELTPSPEVIPSDHRILLYTQRQREALLAEKRAMQKQLDALHSERDVLAAELVKAKESIIELKSVPPRITEIEPHTHRRPELVPSETPLDTDERLLRIAFKGKAPPPASYDDYATQLLE